MERRLVSDDQAIGFWEYSIRHNGHTYTQTVQRDEEGRFRTFVARETVEVVDGVEVDDVEPLWYVTEGSYSSLDEAIDVGDDVIERARPRKP